MSSLLYEYYKILELAPGCTTDDVKKAYRKKAREFHPDINHSPEAQDRFIETTEAYEFLITYFERVSASQEAYQKAMDDWRKYRQMRSRQKARVYARTSYTRFRNTNFYKTTRIFDGTTIISSFVISVAVLFLAIYGYIYRIKHPMAGVEDPSPEQLILLVGLGMILFGTSLVFLRSYINSYKKKKRKHEENK